MSIINNLRKIKKLKSKKITSKKIVLFLLNRKISQHYKGGEFSGKITDITLDRQQKEMIFTITKANEVSIIHVINYKIVVTPNHAFLSWDKVSFDGAAAESYLNLFQGVNRITIPKRGIMIARSMMEARGI